MTRPAAPERVRWNARSRDPAETAAIGAALGRTAPEGAVILLEGPLGSGKTALAQGVGAGCGVGGPVTSPTYNLILHYDGERRFTHVDLYRLEDPVELETLDLDEVLEGGGVTCVEWPSLLATRVRAPYARVRIAVEPGLDSGRRLEGELTGPGWQAARGALNELGAETA